MNLRSDYRDAVGNSPGRVVAAEHQCVIFNGTLMPKTGHFRSAALRCLGISRSGLIGVCTYQ